MKHIMNIFPMLIFFLISKYYDIFMASKFLIISSGLLFILHSIVYKKLDKMNLFSFVIILICGLLTIFFHNSQFIKLKITVLYACFSIILFISQFLINKPIIKNIFEKEIKILDVHWKIIHIYWILFFLFCSILNAYISFYLSEKFWINFKVFGFTILTFFSILITTIYINQKKINNTE